MAIEQEIIAYLAENPDAEDTVEGIMQWWLLEQRIHRTHAEVRTALDELVARNLVMVRQGADGRIYYRANPGKACQRSYEPRWRPSEAVARMNRQEHREHSSNE